MSKFITKSNLQRLFLPISYTIFAVGVLSRDIRLQNIIINRNPAGEFNLKDSFCDSLPRCTRVGSELFGSSIQNFINFIAGIFHGNEVWHYFYLSKQEYFEFFNMISSILFRLACLTPLILYINKLFTSKSNKIIALLALTSIISAWPLFYLNTSFGIYLVNYDYMVILVMSIVLIFYQKIFDSKLLTFFVVFACTTVYENLGILIICSLFFLKKDTHQFFRYLLTAFAAVILSISLLICGVLFKNGFEFTNNSDGRYLQLNLEYWWKITGAIFILLSWGLILGIFVGNLSLYRSSFKQIQFLSEILNTKLYHGMFFGYLVSFVIGFFVSGLVEFARQLLFLQVLSFLYGITLASKSRWYAKD